MSGPYQVKGKYFDYGEIINVTNLADGNISYSEWIDNAWWIKRLILKVSSTKNYDILITRRDSELQTDWSSTVISNYGATGSSFASIPLIDDKGIQGYSFKIGIKNVSGDTSVSDAKIRIECLGDQ